VTYTLLTGEFVIRYPDLPRGGPEPDGDTIKFAPDSPALVEGLPRLSGHSPDLTPRGISVRLEAIDALETHFAETHQELAGADAARDEGLSRLGFTGVVFWPDLPNKIESADQDRRLVPYLATGFEDLGDFDAWLRADPADRDDELFLLDRLERANLHDVVEAEGDGVRLTVWPEDFIIRPRRL